MKTAVVFGSSRKDGNTSDLVQEIAHHMDFTVFNLSDYTITPFDYEHDNLNDDFIGLVKELLKYDFIIFATPVYWYTMSGQMKLFFDRISDLLHVQADLGRQLRNIKAAVVSTGSTPQPERSFEEVFINSFNYLGMHYQGMLYCYCENEFKEQQHKDYINQSLAKILNQ